MTTSPPFRVGELPWNGDWSWSFRFIIAASSNDSASLLVQGIPASVEKISALFWFETTKVPGVTLAAHPLRWFPRLHENWAVPGPSPFLGDGRAPCNQKMGCLPSSLTYRTAVWNLLLRATHPVELSPEVLLNASSLRSQYPPREGTFDCMVPAEAQDASAPPMLVPHRDPLPVSTPSTREYFLTN